MPLPDGRQYTQIGKHLHPDFRSISITVVVAGAFALMLAQAPMAMPEEDQGSCRKCEACEYGHDNELGILLPHKKGNGDATHACLAQSCSYMQENNVHTEGSCAGGGEALVPIEVSRVKTLKDARQLAALYPRTLRVSTGGKYLQRFDCTGDNVIAQFELRPTVIERLRGVLGPASAKSLRRVLVVLSTTPRAFGWV